MKQTSNNVIAILVVILVITIMLEVSVYNIKVRKAITQEAIGLVGLCVDNNPIIIPIEEQIAYIEQLYTYDVNTTVPNDDNVTFYDDTYLFIINSQTGLISFTPQEADEGLHNINISVISSCNIMTDSKIMRLTITYENRPPVLDPIPDQVINQSELLIYDVNATDPDNDTLFFGDNTTMFQINSNTGIIYFIPDQNDVGNQSVLIWVLDGRGGIDWQVVNFEIIDVNDAPVLDTIGSQTAIINETFTYDVNATDVDVKPEWNNLTFYDNATFFSIDDKTGMISFFVDDAMNGTYWINISVTDGELWDEEIISFSVVPMNHPPNITSWYPENDTIEINESESQYFNITKFDLDGTIPSSQWYLNSIELNGETLDEYTYYASYTSSGTHNITVIITDGLLTDSHEWTLIVHDVTQPPSGAIPPSGGQAKPPACEENWRCTEWSVCPIYEIQTRTCRDLNDCGTTKNKPEEKRKCIYTPQPSCSDGVINCHDGGCEIWIDCGGPCPPCATCSDRIKNCHKISKTSTVCEEYVDCGGPCPPCSEAQQPVCGNAMCETGELLSCPQDCGFFFLQYIAVVIILTGASIGIYRGWMFMLMIYRKKIRPLPYTNIELLGASALRRLHLIQLEIGKKPVRIIVTEFSGVIRDFFAKAFDIKKKFTYIELAEVARKRKMEKALANRIAEFSMKMTELEYKVGEPSLVELSSAIKSAITIVERMAGIRIHESLEKHAEEELRKIEPKEEAVSLSQAKPERKPKKYATTEKDAANVKALENMIDEGEMAIANHKTEDAEKLYSRIRELYDEMPPDVKMSLYGETIRIIKLYNEIMKNVK
jgi:hypothetical protein